MMIVGEMNKENIVTIMHFEMILNDLVSSESSEN